MVCFCRIAEPLWFGVVFDSRKQEAASAKRDVDCFGLNSEAARIVMKLRNIRSWDDLTVRQGHTDSVVDAWGSVGSPAPNWWRRFCARWLSAQMVFMQQLGPTMAL